MQVLEQLERCERPWPGRKVSIGDIGEEGLHNLKASRPTLLGEGRPGLNDRHRVVPDRRDLLGEDAVATADVDHRVVLVAVTGDRVHHPLRLRSPQLLAA